MRTLEWIISIERPFAITELQHALAVESTTKTFHRDTIPETGLILEVCSGLVTIDETSRTVRLMHSTAQEYFERNWKVWFPDAHSNIAIACLAYLSLDIRDHPDRVHTWPFYDYADQYWMHHMRLQNVDSPLTMEIFADQSIVTFVDKNLTPQCFCDDPCFPGPNKATALHLASYFGLRRAVEQLISSGTIDCDPKDGNGRTPLAWVSDCPDIRVAKILLEYGADVNHVDSHGTTPLGWAAGFGNLSLVKLLLSRGAMVDIKDHSGLFPLDRAVKGGYRAMVSPLVENGAFTVNSEIENTWDEVSKWARDHGQTGNIIEKNCHNPQCQKSMIHDAASRGLQLEVTRLLDAGASIDTEDSVGGTPLLRAIDDGHADMVRLLIRRGANIFHKDDWDRDMLHGAAVNGQAEIIQILLAHNDSIDINRGDENGETALHDAARHGYTETVKVLLAYGADPNIQDEDGKTPITNARDNERDAVLEMLQAATMNKNIYE